MRIIVPFVLTSVAVLGRAQANWLDELEKATGHPGPLTTEFLDPKKMAYGETGEPLWCTAVRDQSNTLDPEYGK